MSSHLLSSLPICTVSLQVYRADGGEVRAIFRPLLSRPSIG
jgi:hypothetical protein